MTRFLLNNKIIISTQKGGTALLDVIRYEQKLKGTKIGCREGDCGACTVLVGELINGEVHYRSVTSCLLALGSVAGKHVVTIEGLNIQGLNPIQQAMADEGATQCGFCTPGFIMGLAGFCLSRHELSEVNALASIDGNICRCTGYKSIERAAKRLAATMSERGNDDPLEYAASHSILPTYFKDVKGLLHSLKEEISNSVLISGKASGDETRILAGGTDLYVQSHEEMEDRDPAIIVPSDETRSVLLRNNEVHIGPAVTVNTFFDSKIIQEIFPSFREYRKLVSSTPIRNMATIAGNFINASPIGDLTIFFLALNARIEFTDGISGDKRFVPLNKLYKGYKQLDRRESEIVSEIIFDMPTSGFRFHFEKVSKRTHLDIASVNTAIYLEMDNNNEILKVRLSAGGVSPIPLILEKSSNFLLGKKIDEKVILELLNILQAEISPISDARGTAAYKRLLLSQLIKGHFMKLIPGLDAKKLMQLH